MGIAKKRNDLICELLVTVSRDSKFLPRQVSTGQWGKDSIR
jgi:hypothetical protein